jgi:DNA-binding NtrC family response regulator
MTANKPNQSIANAQFNGHAPLAHVLIIDTDSGVRWSLEKGLGRAGYRVSTASSFEQVVPMMTAGEVDVVIMELLPEAGLTLDTLTALVKSPGEHKVICVSVDSSPQTVIECVRRGAADYLAKPFSLAEVRGLVGRTAAPAKQPEEADEAKAADETDSSSSALVGVSAAMTELRQIIFRAAQTNLNCLIRGESGVGKDVIAREIHRLSSERRDRPFVKINCSALPEHLLESELFGYEKGAFTGAYKAKPGRFELAHPGIIFLDEIGDMATGLQAKILQVIEHKEFTKIGGRQAVHVDVQVIAATNADLESKIARGEFRDDLYFRLNEVFIWAPPLRERAEDIPLLVHHFVKKHSEFASAESAGVSGDDLEVLGRYEWPGNIRELESTVKRWLALGRRGKISAHLGGGAVQSIPARPGPEPGKAPGTQHSDSDDDYSPGDVLAALERNQWNRRKAAQELGMSYSALRRRIERHELDKRGRNV